MRLTQKIRSAIKLLKDVEIEGENARATIFILIGQNTLSLKIIFIRLKNTVNLLVPLKMEELF